MKEDKVPKGWKTTYEWSKEFELSESHTRRVIREEVREKRMEMRRYRKRLTDGFIRPCPHYRFVKK